MVWSLNFSSMWMLNHLVGSKISFKNDMGALSPDPCWNCETPIWTMIRSKSRKVIELVDGQTILQIWHRHRQWLAAQKWANRRGEIRKIDSFSDSIPPLSRCQPYRWPKLLVFSQNLPRGCVSMDPKWEFSKGYRWVGTKFDPHFTWLATDNKFSTKCMEAAWICHTWSKCNNGVSKLACVHIIMLCFFCFVLSNKDGTSSFGGTCFCMSAFYCHLGPASQHIFPLVTLSHL